VAEIARGVMRLLRDSRLDRRSQGKLVRFLFDQPRNFKLDPYALAVAVIAEPELILEFPQLGDPKLYANAHALPLVIQVVEEYSEIFQVDLESSEWQTFRNTIEQTANAWPSGVTLEDLFPEDLLRVVADLLLELHMLDDRHYRTSTL
jgi:hypothetical protein